MWPSSARSFRSAALASTLALAPTAALACPCGPGAAPTTALTSPDESFALRASVSALTEVATWNERGTAFRTADDVRTRRALLEVGAAWRPRDTVELALLGGLAYTAADQPGVTVRAVSAGDVTARARWDALMLPHTRAALSGALRVPTGDAVSGSLANGVAGLGLGTWEFALGGEWALRDRTLGEVGVAFEAGVRTPTTSAAGGTWTPGPRLTATVFGAWRATRELTLTGSASQLVELDAWRDGVRVPDSLARRLTVALGANLRVDRLQWTFAVALDPWIDGLGANATATARATVGLTWLR